MSERWHYTVGNYDPDTKVWTDEYETDSFIKAWLYEQRIGWREYWRWITGQGLPRLAFTASLSLTPGAVQ